jgi:hypothetical protein
VSFEASQYVGRGSRATQLLQASTTQTVTGAGTAVAGLGEFTQLLLELDVTAAAAAVGDTLDVFLQTTIDGTNWVDIAHFTQVLGNGGAKRYFAKILATGALTEFENGAALAAAAQRAICGDQYRVRWAIVDGGAHGQSFTFSVTANLQG